MAGFRRAGHNSCPMLNYTTKYLIIIKKVLQDILADTEQTYRSFAGGVSFSDYHR